MNRYWAYKFVGLSCFVAACGGSGGGGADAGIDAGPDEPDAQVDFVPTACDSVDGSRLQRLVIEGAPGVNEERGIVDTEFDVECSYQLENDGTMVCYPDDVGGQLFFQDAQCSAALVGVATGSDAPTFHVQFEVADDGCSVSSEYRLLGVPSSVSAGQNIFVGDPNDCQSITAADLDYYLAGPVLSPDDFVTSTREPFHANSRLTVFVDRGSDGSAMCNHLGGVTDTELEQGCSPVLAEDEETRCIPFAAASFSVFDNNLCDSEVEVVSQDTACPSQPPAFEEEIIDLTCGPGFAIRAVTDTEVTTPFELDVDVCTGVELVDEALFVVGDAVDASEFQGLDAIVEDTDGRLRRRLLGTDDGFALFQNVWQDTLLDTPCTRRDASDGVARCVPQTLSRQTFFSEDTCTTTITLGVIDECTTAGAFFGRNAPQGRRIFAADPHDDPVFDLVDDVCTELTGTFVIEANEVAASSFQAMPE